MIICCNGKEQEVDAGTTVTDLLTLLKLSPQTVVVECNTIIVHPEEYDSFLLPEDGQVELIRCVGGG
ncbi:MAG: sulfur carrier protein ThiS [Spirochaetales bacterium]|jgi:thiamine biosynthesis protein ThiS|nr:sulfur carrier protein ThiS [Spirochaetales bacterium]